MKNDRKNPKEIDSLVPGNNENSRVNNNNQLLELLEDDFVRQGTSRRDFLKLLGFSFVSSAVLASCKRPVQKALPYIIQPPEIVPGKSLYYATSFYDGHEYSGIVVKTKDGRPIKIEGCKGDCK
jgi:hypothetical protein